MSFLKPAVFTLSLLPLAWCILQVVLLTTGSAHGLGKDPGRGILLFQGEWALRFLFITLLVTPVRQLTGLSELARIRRMLGLFCFTYASLHLASYCAFLLEFRWNEIVSEIRERPFITVGFSAYLLLLPLALTSNNLAMRALKQRWQQLHRLIYLILILAIVHLIWLTRSDYTEAIVHGGIAAFLLFYRVFSPAILRYKKTLEST